MEVTASDVAKCVSRDFEPYIQQDVLDELAHYGQGWAYFMQLAILRLANGDPMLVVDYVELANTDYRDVLANIHTTYGIHWENDFLSGAAS